MRYTFKDLLTAEIYDSTRVMVVVGKYDIFNSLVADELKAMCTSDYVSDGTAGVLNEFGLADETYEESGISSVTFQTFMDVIGVQCLNGKWYCRVEYGTLSKKQKEQFLKYIKNPADTGILVVTSNDWKEYKDLLNNKALGFGRNTHIMNLNFADKIVLKKIVAQLFEDKGMSIQSSAVDMFITKMSLAYDEYEQVIGNIKDINEGKEEITVNNLKTYMKGIEHYQIADFIEQLIKPMSSDKTNAKKVLKILVILEDEYGCKNLTYNLINIIDDYIEFRTLINKGVIPIGINYFYKDVMKDINALYGEKNKFEKLSEYTFRKRAIIASQTSMRDWVYMKLILSKAVRDIKISDEEFDNRCQKALYDLCTRSVLYSDRLNYIIGVDNVLKKPLIELDRVIFDEEALKQTYKPNLEKIETVEEN